MIHRFGFLGASFTLQLQAQPRPKTVVELDLRWIHNAIFDRGTIHKEAAFIGGLCLSGLAPTSENAAGAAAYMNC